MQPVQLISGWLQHSAVTEASRAGMVDGFLKGQVWEPPFIACSLEARDKYISLQEIRNALNLAASFQIFCGFIKVDVFTLGKIRI